LNAQILRTLAHVDAIGEPLYVINSAQTAPWHPHILDQDVRIVALLPGERTLGESAVKKLLLILTAAALVAGATFTGSAIAQNRGDRSDRTALTANQIVAQSDARTARIKADLRLTPEQEKNWPSLEAVLHEIGQTRADRLVAFRDERGQPKEPGDVIEYLNNTAKFLSEHSANVKKLADAAQPLYVSLDEQQKRRFANELIRLSREGEIEQ
jgi:hypothetical protein